MKEKTISYKPSSIGVIFIVSLLHIGCGYRFAGRGSLPQDIHTMAIPVFINKTTETGIENIFTSALVEEFTRTKRVRIVDESGSDAVLKGVITSYSVWPMYYTQDGRVRRYRVTVSVDAQLIRRAGIQDKSPDILWQVRGLTENEDYDAIVSAILLTKGEERVAVEKIARDLMEEIHDRIFENF